MIDGVRGPQLKETVFETLRKEVRAPCTDTSHKILVESFAIQAQSLTKLRHPDLLQISEPLEETRSELTFVTEAITGSLTGILKDLTENVHGPGADGRSRGTSSGLEVDEVEVSHTTLRVGDLTLTNRRSPGKQIQKGVLQVSRALSFLHNQAKLVHLNINPDAILINTKVRRASTVDLTLPIPADQLDFDVSGGLETLRTYPHHAYPLVLIFSNTAEVRLSRGG